MNALDRRHPSQRLYYRNVRNALSVAIVAHAAILAFVPVPLAPPRVTGPDLLRVIDASVSLIPGGSARERAPAVDSPVLPAAETAATGTMRAIEDPVRTVPASEELPAAGRESGPRSGIAGGSASGSIAADEAPPVFYAYDVAPRAVRRIEPAYPAGARAAGFEGTVVVNLNIDERGRILRAWVAESNAAEVLIASALDAAYQFEFEPGRWRGAAVPCTVAIPFQFRLKQFLEVEGH